MCTISWLYLEHEYHVFFNRDELRSRPVATPPGEYSFGASKVLMPVDPQGNGSWLSTNDNGVTLALLNYYQGVAPDEPLLSRGQIIRQLSGFTGVSDISQVMDEIELSRYAPFTLLAFTPGDYDDLLPAIPMWRWNGRELLVSSQDCPLISSGKFYDDVMLSRTRLFDVITANRSELTEKNFYKLHREHGPNGLSPYGVCMHREDACTVSFSHIRVTGEKCWFHYFRGSPCIGHFPHISSLSLRQKSL